MMQCMCTVHVHVLRRWAWMNATKDGGQRFLGELDAVSGLRVQAHRVALPYAVQRGPDRTARGPPVWQKEPARYPGLSCACRSRAVTLSEADPSPVLVRSSARPRAHPCHRDGTRRSIKPVAHAQHSICGSKRRRVRTACGVRTETRRWPSSSLAFAPPATVVERRAGRDRACSACRTR